VLKTQYLVAMSCVIGVLNHFAVAEYIQFTYTASVTTSTGPFNPWYDADYGDIVTIQYLIDPNAVDQTPSEVIGKYDFIDLSFTLNGVTRWANDGYIAVSPGSTFIPHDFYSVRYSIDDNLYGGFSFQGQYPFGMMFDSDALPTDTDWTQYASSSDGTMFDKESGYRLDYQTISLEAIVVPAPTTLLLIVLGSRCVRRRGQSS
jgi:hypothetical protein